jgi:holo-[acyl-carrier protein] synthase
MTAGIGVDIVDIERIERLVARYDRSFVQRVFTPAEIEYCGRMARPGVHYAGRFAVKEAFYKALPPSCQPHGRWRGIETLGDSSGRPRVHVVDEYLAESLDEAGVRGIQVSISHERHYCVAMVLLETMA